MLTFAAACATAEPSLDRGVNLPHGVYLNVHETHYPVTGTDEEGIGRSLQEGGPTTRAGRKVAARFEWDMRSNWSWTSTSRGCVMEDVEITVTARVTMPRWDPAGAPAELELSWEQFLEALRTHEQGHHDHVARAARELHRSLTRLEVDNCSFMRGEAQALYDRILSRWKRVDMEYEVETENGRTQGAVWPPRVRSSDPSGTRNPEVP